MKFIAIDFETANLRVRSSACALGIAVVENSRIVEQKYWLINPQCEFDDYCIRVHGITPKMVANQPTFRELWPTIKHYFEGTSMIAHNASFDFSVYRYCLADANETSPTLNYYCTYRLSKKWLDGLHGYSLDVIADHLGIAFQHHHAQEDARVAAMLMIHMQNELGLTDLNALAERFDFVPGTVHAHGYQSFSVKSNKTSKSGWQKVRASDIVSTHTEFDAEHPLFGKKVVFTGTLESMTRKEAMQKVVDVGGHVLDSVNKNVNVLVVGSYDYRKFREGHKSSKLNKAESFILRGAELEIVDERDFLRFL